MVMGVGDDDEDRLADILHQTIAEDRVIMQDRTAIIDAGDVLRGEDRHHTGRRFDRIERDRGDTGMGFLRQAECGMQGAVQFRDVIGVRGFAQHMQQG